MLKSKIYTVGFKRKRKRITDYNSRIKYLKSGKTRIVIRPSNKNLIIQAVRYNENGDLIISTTKALELRKLKWKYNLGNVPSSYLTGLYFGMKNKNKIKDGIIDIGLRSITKGDRISAVIKGIVDADINVSHSDKVFPSEEKLDGTTISNYFKNKKDKNTQFSKYLKENLNLKNIPQDFQRIKENIILGKK